ncbi:MAG: protein kinase [Ignavibacteriae bacterium]|nr:protein kinase [Ignavibacteriota bacterium]
MIGQTISHYKILEKLGEGGMGVVYKAQDLRLDRIVALKFLPTTVLASQDEIQRFQQEAKAISSLNHPNIETLYDINEANGQRFLVLEYLPGGTLKTKIQSLHATGKKLLLHEVINYAIQIAQGLAHAHRHGIIHRDVKTENLLLTEEGQVKISDFGLAKLRGSRQLTKTGSTLGTVAYMSPEQIRGESVDQRSDLFSFGVVLYELLAGTLPFRGEHEAALTYSIVHEEPTSVQSLRADVPSTLERVIARCLEKETDKRFQTAEEIISELEVVKKEFSAHVARSKRPSGVVLIAVAIVIILAIVGVYILLPTKSISVDRKSIAVLPFKNMSEDKENEYFSDGITEDIITQLSKIGDLKVISRTSVMRYKASDKSLRDIGGELDVATILEGSVRRAGNRLRIVSQLIDASSDEHIWAETYDREMKDVFDIQSDVAQKIAAALQAKLSPAEISRIEQKPTENLEAYAYYLKGREYYYRYHKQDNEHAIELFKKALELDPNYALAYAGLGDAYAQRVQKFGFPDNWNDSALEVSKKAVSIDLNLAEAYKALGLALGQKGWMHKALEANHRAVELNPNYAPAVGNIGWLNLWFGDLEEAFVWFKKSMVINPAFAYNYLELGFLYTILDEDTKAELWFKKSFGIQPDFTYAYAGLSLLYLKQGKYQQALEEAKKILVKEPDDIAGLFPAGDVELFSGNYPQAKSYYEKAIAIDSAGLFIFSSMRSTTRLGYIYWKLGQQDQAQKLFNHSLTLDQKHLANDEEWYVMPYDIAVIHVILGNKKEAYTWLQKAIDAGWRDYRYALIDPMLENLHNDDRFKRMMAEVKGKVDEQRNRIDEMEKK